MDPVTLIVTALAAGQPGAEFVLAEHEADPETWAAPLAKKLTEAGAADDASLVEVARALMELVDAAGTAAGKYNVTIKDSHFAEAKTLASELGHLPLALAQAAAVIAAQHLTYPACLSRLRSCPARKHPPPAKGEPYPAGARKRSRCPSTR